MWSIWRSAGSTPRGPPRRFGTRKWSQMGPRRAPKGHWGPQDEPKTAPKAGRKLAERRPRSAERGTGKTFRAPVSRKRFKYYQNQCKINKAHKLKFLPVGSHSANQHPSLLPTLGRAIKIYPPQKQSWTWSTIIIDDPC